MPLPNRSNRWMYTRQEWDDLVRQNQQPIPPQAEVPLQPRQVMPVAEDRGPVMPLPAIERPVLTRVVPPGGDVRDVPLPGPSGATTAIAGQVPLVATSTSVLRQAQDAAPTPLPVAPPPRPTELSREDRDALRNFMMTDRTQARVYGDELRSQQRNWDHTYDPRYSVGMRQSLAALDPAISGSAGRGQAMPVLNPLDFPAPEAPRVSPHTPLGPLSVPAVSRANVVPGIGTGRTPEESLANLLAQRPGRQGNVLAHGATEEDLGRYLLRQRAASRPAVQSATPLEARPADRITELINSLDNVPTVPEYHNTPSGAVWTRNVPDPNVLRARVEAARILADRESSQAQTAAILRGQDHPASAIAREIQAYQQFQATHPSLRGQQVVEEWMRQGGRHPRIFLGGGIPPLPQGPSGPGQNGQSLGVNGPPLGQETFVPSTDLGSIAYPGGETVDSRGNPIRVKRPIAEFMAALPAAATNTPSSLADTMSYIQREYPNEFADWWGRYSSWFAMNDNEQDRARDRFRNAINAQLPGQASQRFPFWVNLPTNLAIFNRGAMENRPIDLSTLSATLRARANDRATPLGNRVR